MLIFVELSGRCWSALGHIWANFRTARRLRSVPGNSARGNDPSVVFYPAWRKVTITATCEKKLSSSTFQNRSASAAARSAVICMPLLPAPDPSDDPSRTSTILPVTPPFPSNSCACLASVRESAPR